MQVKKRDAVRGLAAWRAGILATSIMIMCAPAFAQAIDLTKPYGTAVGCQNQAGQKVESEDMLLLTKDSIVTSTSTCTFVQTQTAPDGTLVLTTLCNIEGEEGRSINMLSVTRSKADPTKLAIFDEYGAAFDTVSVCP